MRQDNLGEKRISPLKNHEQLTVGCADGDTEGLDVGLADGELLGFWDVVGAALGCAEIVGAMDTVGLCDGA